MLMNQVCVKVSALLLATVGLCSLGWAGEMKAALEDMKGDAKAKVEELKGEAKAAVEEAKGNKVQAEVERTKGKGNASPFPRSASALRKRSTAATIPSLAAAGGGSLTERDWSHAPLLRDSVPGLLGRDRAVCGDPRSQHQGLCGRRPLPSFAGGHGHGVCDLVRG